MSAAAVMLAAGLGGFLLVHHLFDYYTDGFAIHQRSAEADVRKILWEEPVPFPADFAPAGADGSAEVYEPTLSADGLVMIFTAGKAGKNADLFVAAWNGRAFGVPEPLAAVNSESDDLGPELSRDGRFLFFYSNRPAGLGGYDIWVSRRTPEGWSEPDNLGSSVNSEFNEYGPVLSPAGDELFFSSNRLGRGLTDEEKAAWPATLRESFPGKDYDIFRSRRVGPEAGRKPDAAESEAAGAAEHGFPAPLPEFLPAEPVAELNSEADEGEVSLTPRAEFIYFSSNRGGGLGGFDLYRSRVLAGEILEPQNLGEPVNSRFDDLDPALFLEGHGLLFSSNRELAGAGRPFKIFRTVSREVMVAQDWSGLAALFRALDRIKWPLLLLLLGLLALLWLLKYLAGQRFRLHATLLQKCLLLSLLVHLLVAFLMSTWIVTATLYELHREGGGEILLAADALAGERLSLEIREDVAEFAAASPAEAPEDEAMAAFGLDADFEPESLAAEEIDFADPERVFAPALLRTEAKDRDAAEGLEPLAFASALEPLAAGSGRVALEAAQPAPRRDDATPAAPESAFAAEQPARPADAISAGPAALPAAALSGSSLPESAPRAAASLAPPLRSSLGAAEAGEALRRLAVLDLPATTLPSRVDLQIAMESPAANGVSEGEPEDLLAAPPPAPSSRTDAAPDAGPGEAVVVAAAAGAAPQIPGASALDAGEPVRSPASAVVDRASARRLSDPDAALPPVSVSVEPTAWKPPAVLPDRTMETFTPDPGRGPASEHREPAAAGPAPAQASVPAAPERGAPSPLAAAPAERRGQIPVEGLIDLPKLEPLPLPEPEREKASAQLAVASPTRTMEPEAGLDRFAHGALRTYHGIAMDSRKVVFCLDVSTSMEWNDRIGEARRELLRLLDTLDESVEFNIITFSGRVSIWSRSGVLRGTEENLASAEEFVRRTRIGADGTNTVGALAAALADTQVQSIYFLSDGHPTVGVTTDSDQILDIVRQGRGERPIAIHTIAYVKGDPPAEWRHEVPSKDLLIDLMRRLAEQNNGRFVVFDD